MRREWASVVVIGLERLAAIKINLVLNSVVVAVHLRVLTIVPIVHLILISIHKALLKRSIWLAIIELVKIGIVSKRIRVVVVILVIVVGWLVIIILKLVSGGIYLIHVFSLHLLDIILIMQYSVLITLVVTATRGLVHLLYIALYMVLVQIVKALIVGFCKVIK